MALRTLTHARTLTLSWSLELVVSCTHNIACVRARPRVDPRIPELRSALALQIAAWAPSYAPGRRAMRWGRATSHDIKSNQIHHQSWHCDGSIHSGVDQRHHVGRHFLKTIMHSLGLSIYNLLHHIPCHRQPEPNTQSYSILDQHWTLNNCCNSIHDIDWSLNIKSLVINEY